VWCRSSAESRAPLPIGKSSTGIVDRVERWLVLPEVPVRSGQRLRGQTDHLSDAHDGGAPGHGRRASLGSGAEGDPALAPGNAARGLRSPRRLRGRTPSTFASPRPRLRTSAYEYAPGRGYPLRILNSTHNPDRCRSGGARSGAIYPFPLLEAQRAGRWTVIASKRSRQPADVAITSRAAGRCPGAAPENGNQRARQTRPPESARGSQRTHSSETVPGPARDVAQAARSPCLTGG